uniref:Chromo domain-containing protein n=1 Tax=Peronospora matthiolae TaxID=2874970 RepID=A0AAV1UFB6_9STRA
MKNALALKHLAESLVLPMVGINKGLKSSYLIPRPINNPTSYPSLVTQRCQRSLVLKLSKDKLTSMLQDSVRQLKTPAPLMLEVAVQRKSYAIKEAVGNTCLPTISYLVEQLLNHRDVNGRRTSYLVWWRGYHPFWDTWEPRSQLMIDVLGLVEPYEAADPVPQKDRRRKSSRHGRKGISGCQSLRTSH